MDKDKVHTGNRFLWFKAHDGEGAPRVVEVIGHRDKNAVVQSETGVVHYVPYGQLEPIEVDGRMIH